MDYKPKTEEIVRDEVEFYAQTILKFGIVFNAWYKVGTSKNIGEGHKEALFADNLAELNEDPKIHWNVWQFNKQPFIQGKLDKKYAQFIERGGVIPYVDIINRLKFGYFKYKLPGWKIENGKNVPIIE